METRRNLSGPGLHASLRAYFKGIRYLPTNRLVKKITYILMFLGTTTFRPLIRWRRRSLAQANFIAVTGSAGKTTTKNLLGAIFSEFSPSVASTGTRNRETEMLRVLFLRMRERHRFCVQEMGAFSQGTLAPFVDLFEPDVAVVLNVGQEHYSAFRSFETVAREKAVLVRALSENGTAILNGDDPHVREMAGQTRGKILFFGTGADCDVRGENAVSRWPDPLTFDLVWKGERISVRTSHYGTQWLSAFLAAFAVVASEGLDLGRAAEAAARLKPEPGRMSPVHFSNDVTLIRDDWKAASQALSWIFDFLSNARARRKFVVLGQISDDPSKPKRLYRKVARQAVNVADRVLMIGRWAYYAEGIRREPDGPPVAIFSDLGSLADFLYAELAPGDLVVVKGTDNQDGLAGLSDLLEERGLVRRSEG